MREAFSGKPNQLTSSYFLHYIPFLWHTLHHVSHSHARHSGVPAFQELRVYSATSLDLSSASGIQPLNGACQCEVTKL